MKRSGNTPEYQALAQFRFLIRRYLNNSEKAARSVGLEPQQYMGLLALRGLPPDQDPTIRSLAERLQGAFFVANVPARTGARCTCT